MKTTQKSLPGITGTTVHSEVYPRSRQQILQPDFFNNRLPLYGNKGAHDNKAAKAFVNLVMAGSYLHTTISYPNLIISNGRLPGAENANATLNNDGDIVFTWADNSGITTANTDDKVILITYFPAIKKMIYTLHAATRGSCRALLQINKMKGYTAETWVGFVSNDERDAGDSVYVGKVNL